MKALYNNECWLIGTCRVMGFYSNDRARDGAEAQEWAPAHRGRVQSKSPRGERECRHHPRADPSEGRRTQTDRPGVYKVRSNIIITIISWCIESCRNERCWSMNANVVSNMPSCNRNSQIYVSSYWLINCLTLVNAQKACLTANWYLLSGLQVLCLEKDSGPLCQTGTKSQPRWGICSHPQSAQWMITVIRNKQ